MRFAYSNNSSLYSSSSVEKIPYVLDKLEQYKVVLDKLEQ